jgi:hypothetical protein
LSAFAKETIMTIHKDLKRLVRSRMKKTGESYTAARARLTSKKFASNQAARPESPASDFAALAGMCDAAVRARTGRTWSQWVRVLDAIGATQMPHSGIARHVNESYRVGSWWAQSVTVGYERIRGLRQRGQRREGWYEATKSKTFPVGVGRLYDAFASEQTRSHWLPGVALTIRSANENRSLRITWPDGTRVEFSFVAKGERSQVSVQHIRLVSKEDAEERKCYWAERLSVLAALLAHSG